MAKESGKARVGRPRSDKPKTIQVAYRIDLPTQQALEKMRDKLGIIGFSLSDTARQLMLRELKREGLL